MRKSIAAVAILAATQMFAVDLNGQFFKQMNAFTEAAVAKMLEGAGVTVDPKAEFTEYGKYDDYVIIKNEVGNLNGYVTPNQFYFYDEAKDILINDFVDVKNADTPVFQLKNQARVDSIKRYLDMNRRGLRDVVVGEQFLNKEGKNNLVIWVDPLCPHCVNKLKSLPSYEDIIKNETAVQFILYPILGEQSVRTTAALVKKLAGIKTEKERYEFLKTELGKEYREDITDLSLIEQLQKDQVQWQIYGIRAVPFEASAIIGFQTKGDRKVEIFDKK